MRREIEIYKGFKIGDNTKLGVISDMYINSNGCCNTFVIFVIDGKNYKWEDII